MTFDEYQESGRALYVGLVESIQNILLQALQQQNLVAYAVTGRAKELGSLRQKLSDRGIGLKEPMDEIKDLSGCRVVFLTNSQVDAFTNTGALHDNFDVLSVNVHHPVPGTDTETKLFDSTNYFVRLKPERLALAEYRRFEGLVAEIQIQTLLNHAWSEMGHDTIYKEPKLAHLGNSRMTEIGERMNKVMQDHLVPAGHDFDKIARDFRKLVEADAAAETTLDSIRHAQNNNDLEDALEKYTDLVLPHYDEPAAEFSKLLETLIGAVERARDYSAVPIDTQFGKYPGKSALDVARRVADLVRSYPYWEMDRTFHALVQLHLGARDEEERRIWIEVGAKFAEHNLSVWKRYGPAAQQVILQEMKELEVEAITACRPLLVAMLAKVLSADLEGTSWRSDSVTIHQGSVGVSDELRRLREESIGWLERWLDAAADDDERLSILRALGNADAVPMHGSADEQLMLMLLEDGARVARLTLERAGRWSLELRRGQEIDALHTHYRFHVLRPDLAEKPELVSAQKELINALLSLRDQLSSDQDFMLYKTLIGHDSVRPDAWHGDHFDYEATDAWRRGRYPEIVADIDVEGVPQWTARIACYVEAAGNDGGHFMPMREFLGLLSEQKPDVALLMLEEVSRQLAPFVAAMLAGLERAGHGVEVLARVDRWLAAGQILPALGDYLQHKSEADPARLQAYALKAIERDENASVVHAATIAAVWYQREPNATLIDAVLISVIRFVTEHQIPFWIGHFFTPGDALIVQALTEQQASELLQSFVDIAEVDYRAVRLLVAVGRRHPQLVVDFFGTRLQRDRQEVGDRFEPIPFHSHDLAEVLSPHAELLLPAAKRWFEHQGQFHEYRGGRLVKHAFPELTDELARQLIDLARHGDRSDLKFILKTLSPYEGAQQIYPVCMEVVNRLEPGDKLLNKVSIVLGETGVVSGEFGFVEAHTLRRDRIEKYRDDPRPRVQAYARARARELSQHMAWEQRRAARDVAQRRRDWNEE